MARAMISEDVFIGLGSNLGKRLLYLQQAFGRIENLENTSIEDHSSVYQTEPVGPVSQGDFLNQVVRIRTLFGPPDLLFELQEIEKSLGRTREKPWGPRTIDLDIIFWGQRIIDIEGLTVPHPERNNRKFVLLPLAEIAGDWATPPAGLIVSDLLQDCEDSSDVLPYLSKHDFSLKMRR